jgi:hypothetical protein
MASVVLSLDEYLNAVAANRRAQDAARRTRDLALLEELQAQARLIET